MPARSDSDRDFLAAVRERVVVFDGGMGATLEQFDLTQEDYGGLAGQVPRGAGAQPPRRDRGRPRVDARGRRRGGRDRHLPGLAAEARRVGAGRAHARDQHQGGRDRPQGRRARRASSPARSGRPASCPPPTTRPSATISFRELVEVFAEQARGLVEGGADLIIIETAQDILEVKAAVFGAREAFAATGRTLPIQTSVSLLPQGGKMLLGTDIQAVLTTLGGARRRRDRAQLLDRARGHARRDPLPRRALARCPSTASPTPACRSRGPTARRSSPRRPSRSSTVLGEFVERYGVGIVGGCCGTTPGAHPRRSPSGSTAACRASAPPPGPPQVSSMMTATAAGPGAAPDPGRRAGQLAGLAQGEGAAARRRLRRPRPGRRGPGRRRRPRARRLRGADRAPGRGRADERGGQAGLADPAGADPGRLDRARGDRGRARADPGPGDRQLDQPRGRPRQGRRASCRWPRRTAPR